MTLDYRQWPAMARRWLELRRFTRQLDANLQARRNARASGKVYVSGYVRGKS